MASVWCAEDLVLGRTVAIKVLSERFAHDDMAVRRFKREARAAARVSTHPHVVTIFDIGDLPGEEGAPDRAFIVMEHLAGGTLADAIRVGAVRRREALRWLSEAASALDYAHERGIVHRDIKPANFLLDRSRVLHVADFGIARLVSEDTISSAGELFGTAAYLSPEQALGLEATGASDRYALAVAAFELLTGERPFTAQHFTAQARQHIEDPPPLASGRDRTLPPAVDDVLVRGMAKQPDERFTSAGEMIEALDEALAGAPPAPVRAGPASARPARPAPITRQIDLERRRRASAGPAAPASAAAGARRSGSSVGRGIALAALLVAIVGIGVVLVGAGTGTPHRAASRRSTTLRASVAKPAPARRHHLAATTTSSTTTTAAATTTTTTTAPAPPTAEQLQLTGHQEMLAGNFSQAITTLRAATVAASPGSLTFAYALYDLGRSLMLSGDPAGAVPILEQRAKIPNQTVVVLQTLHQAMQASGQVPGKLQSGTATSGTTTPTSPGHSGQAPGHTKPGAPGSSGGAGIGPPKVGKDIQPGISGLQFAAASA